MGHDLTSLSLPKELGSMTDGILGSGRLSGLPVPHGFEIFHVGVRNPVVTAAPQGMHGQEAGVRSHSWVPGPVIWDLAELKDHLHPEVSDREPKHPRIRLSWSVGVSAGIGAQQSGSCVGEAGLQRGHGS